ncbi:SNF2 family helicase/ATPase [Spraguea lophii 42_110]|uniref:SNF2 family helicase/ATPase n=1 Tax=Spraguea lophii (strain 42_110) TaxID=1358809 RepID=S7XH59_SPRLO|nr:SNF2 family helicase/ATPase [Spraguea lophii 42_110]
MYLFILCNINIKIIFILFIFFFFYKIFCFKFNHPMIDKFYEEFKDIVENNQFLKNLFESSSKIESKKKGKHRKALKEDVNVTNEMGFSFRNSPNYIQAELREYQIEGLNWLINMHEKGINGILADEMGLGKTLQTISFLGYLKIFLKEKKPHLLIVPKSILLNWKKEIDKFLPDLKYFLFHATKENIKEAKTEFLEMDFDICITTYEMCMYHKKLFQGVEWSYIIIDEAHRIKNEKSLLSQVIRLFSCDHRLLLTGTPLQNNLHELWSLLNFLLPTLFNDSEKFERLINEMDSENEESIEKLRQVLQLFFLRREKADVERSLLPKKIINLYTQLTPMQREWYRMILEKDVTSIIKGKEVRSLLLNVVTQLRKCCNHPYLFPGAEPEPFTTDEHIVFNCGKMKVLDQLLKNLKAKGSRVLLFSQMTTMLDIIEDYCNFREFEYRRIDGSTSTAERGQNIEDFNKDDSDVFIFLLSTRAGGLGINLATADTVIIYDSDWNPQMDLQAQDRAHRIGQKKQVYVFRLITQNTIEENIIFQSLKKLKLDEVLVQQSKRANTALSQNELLQVLSSGIEKLYENVEEKDLNIEEIIKIGEEKTKSLNEKLEGIKISETNEKNYELYKWEGEDYKSKTKLERFVKPEQKKRSSSLLKISKPRILQLPEYQFFPKELLEIQKKELRYYEDLGDPITEEERNSKDELYKKGFITWTKKDYFSFIKACEKNGRNNLSIISNSIESKTAEEVLEYHKIFFNRIEELPEYNKILNQIQRGEEKILKKQHLKDLLNKFTENNLNISYTYNLRSKIFTEEIDLELIHLLKKYIDDEYSNEKIVKELKNNPDYRYDYFVRTIKPSDVQKRLTTLTQNILKKEIFYIK